MKTTLIEHSPALVRAVHEIFHNSEPCHCHGEGKLSEKDVDAALREVRLALLEADVDFKVVRQFVKTVSQRAEGDKVFTSLSPGQSVIRIVQEELAQILGGETAELARADRPPSVIMLVGLQGSGKTTLAAKLALSLRKEKHPVMMAACDLQRPAAVDQLVQLGKQLDIDVYSEEPSRMEHSGLSPPSHLAMICFN